MIEVPGRSGIDVRVFDVPDVRPRCGMITNECALEKWSRWGRSRSPHHWAHVLGSLPDVQGSDEREWPNAEPGLDREPRSPLI
jgi:hypothetical protein